MVSPLIRFIGMVVLFLLVSAGSSEAAVVKVSPANVQASIDKLPESTPDSDKPKSLQAIIADSATYAGDEDDEDVIEFGAGTYDDIGELLVMRPLTLRKDPAAEGDAVITGELLIQIRSKEVKVEDLTFRNLELGDATVLQEGERNINQVGPDVFYFGDVTLQSFLLDRKAKASAWQASNGCPSDPSTCTASCPDSLPDCKHNYRSYTGQFHKTELAKHLREDSDSWCQSQNNRCQQDATASEFTPQQFVINKETGIPVDYVGGTSLYGFRDPETSTTISKWDINLSGASLSWMKNVFGGHILINPRWNSVPSPAPCPAAEAFTGIEITRNSFDGTEVGAIFLFEEGEWVMSRGAKSCAVDIKVVGNTFRNIGVADSSYLVARDENGLPRTDSSGNPVFLMDENGNRIPYNNEDETAVQLQGTARKVTISDNTIEGTTFGTLRFRKGVAANAEITISNNLIRAFTSGGNRYADALVVVDDCPKVDRNDPDRPCIESEEDAKITISGNRLFASDSNPVYSTTFYSAVLRRMQWCSNDDDTKIVAATTIAQIDRSLQPTIMQSYVPNFPYPPLSSGNVVDAGDGETEGPARATPVRLAELARASATAGDFRLSAADDGILKSDDIMIGKNDIVRYKSCHRRVGIFLRANENAKISLVDNDISYGDGAALVDNAIELWSVEKAAAPGFEAFSGNNIGNYAKNLVGGEFSGQLAVKGNYIGPRPRVPSSVTLVLAGELLEPITRESGAIGPRAGMNADSRPEAPRIASASVSPTARDMIVVTYNTNLVAESVPPATAFTVQYRVEGSERIEVVNASRVSVSGMTVTLTLAKEIPSGASGVTVVYTAPDGDAAVRSRLGSISAGNQRSPVTTGDDGDPSPPVDQPRGGGDGGCALASSESGGAGLGTLLFLTVVVSFAFTAGRKRRYNA